MRLLKQHLLPLDAAYRGRSIFPIREDDSVFMSLAAFRDHLLGETLKQAFRRAANPSKLFVGAVVQNCFGDEYTCKTGRQVVGKDKQGNPITKVSDAPPDVNGIEQFCSDPSYRPYCEAGQIRVLYVNETESIGPAVARYYASKLWGGENFYIQSDAHLRFAQDWDAKYIAEVKSADSYPKAVLSSYPPGFSEEDPPDYEGGTIGTRLCSCMFSNSPVEQDIIRINSGASCTNPDVDGPTQIAFIAAGFFFAHGSFLQDVPFDPLLPWCFMGEEIALSMRAWTAGWNIYAPRQNLIAHQYRPGRMGLPKFWGSVGRTFGREGPGFNTHMQSVLIQRIKHMVGYPEVSKEKIKQGGFDDILTDLEHYSMGTERSKQAYLELTKIDPANHKCSAISWCNRCELK
uniref:Glycosyltransferase 2-like domain-containing protein n=2 Tax=Helicotheca tamesis TaxID=374047 RepID=A0A7S2HSP7_9STRA|mmetsp:Transcript_2173/g.3057  ORF Transcript_2173/g.3057 Transcript_2173/m.3057 type:complete len:402 (+) Transcript_2173:387-1592(+)